MKIISKTFIALLILCSIVGCGNSNSSLDSLGGSISSSINENSTEYEVIDKSVSNVKTKDGEYVMPFNTIVTLRTFCKKDYNEIYPTFNTEMQRLHILFDRYNDFVDKDGRDIINLKDINESYGTGEVLIVDQDLIDLLSLSIQLSKLTEGYFNPTLGELIDTWNYKYEEGEKYVRFSPYCFEDQDPDVESIETSKNKVIPYNELENYLIINDEDNTIEFKKYQDIDKVTLSLGAIAKGYAVEKTKSIVDMFNTSAMIDGGSSSSYGIGTNPHPDRDYWAVGIASPYKSALGVQSMVNVKFEGTYTLSVSGDYENCYKTKDGIIRHHILNPYSGYPENFYRVISLKSESRSEILDGLSTALFSIESTTKVMEIVNKVEDYYNIKISVLLEKEIDKENSKIDLYLTDSYDRQITKVNSKFYNDKIYI